jgi:hypothetical protein
MNTKQLLDSALVRFDQVGYRLDQYGIASNVNRHQVIACLMAEQKRLEGELDSLKARVGFRRLQVERIIGQVESTARGGLDLALKPARYTLGSLRNFLGSV